ncbi:MAG: ABC transporter [Gammaproteobacteria bacterium (ex Lamellibrachia satsuma)]|nr:MAG: ABC transporter permease [Gammaproteobacteria bacterium (ex Lamellibrachia satsuma)]RRS31216.1 MAG: ABC transporter [Gammaproteobacteria bacterium (ex Lamellibrachia satsuma)]RRS33331.1 MAG: ABC transporter [Gammaproteobacteria bacterium (ex Lamellibrachia satsuma)]
MSWRRLLAVIRKEIWQLKRDRLTFAMILGIPAMQILMFGYAINTDVRHINTAVVDQANTQLSRSFIADIRASQVTQVRYQVAQASELEDLMRSGKISLGIFVPADFERRIQDDSRPGVQLLVDGSDPIILGVAQQLTAMRLKQDTQAGLPVTGPLFELRNYYNPEHRSAVNVVPGLIGVILTMTMMMFTAVAIVRERERGNLELLINTPISTFELMVGKVLPYIVIGLVQVTLVLVLGMWLFDVPLRGSLWHVYVVSLMLVAANLTLGLLFSTLARSQFQAVQMAFFVMLPSILLSGFMFPFDGMPKLAQWIAEVLPLTHFVRLIRGVMLRGASLSELYVELVALSLITLVTLILATWRFSKRLD